MNAHAEIPVVDVSHFAGADTAQRVAVAERICAVARALGFVYLRGVAIAQSEVDALFAQLATFFALPAAVKSRLATAHRASDALRCGYVPQGREHEDPATPSDIKEAFDLFSEAGYYAETFPATPEGAVAEPTPDVAEFITGFDRFHARCARVADDILRAFAMGFGLSESYFVERHGRNNMLRLLHYPPIPEHVIKGQMRVGAHTDFGTLTLLFQDPSGGLEVLSADGQWICAPSIPNTVLINIGDLMQRWTNREFRSTSHRVGLPGDERGSRSRYSVAFFCEPNNETDVASLGTGQNSDSPLYAPLNAGDHLRARLKGTLIGNG
jgi:isopenicillin N synthase-like dioxygenase